ncbi:MAG TPA: AAA family ATPase, partial [Steroidobacteraceae bacterium]|nr:AAA family ATPase [Steroidobacteraceae bacterium]
MRLTKIKLAGFKSFVDPTQINFPSNLTGVVGPNGCGKSNVIDAVRWVMGELSAKHLRGDNMADVVFNGSAARKPVGAASVELVFDNADGKIGGAYANYGEISLKRQVLREGTSSYFINGTRCRRKDITNLFLGTGLGSRSYAIIEQGMISRVIDAHTDDMRAFVEEAAGISRYKERRKETEARIAETRENLERLQDVRDEVEKQIRHLQRQAATARRYQAQKELERRLVAELLALRMRDLDSGAEAHDATVRERELAMQAELAAQRAAEAAIARARTVQQAHSDALAAVQARYYEVGTDISRLEQTITHIRELRARQHTDLEQTRATLADLAGHISRDERELAAVREEIARFTPELDAAQEAEAAAGAALEERERTLHEWQERWEAHSRATGSAQQSAEVERARIEQLENQLRRLGNQVERLSAEQVSLGAEDHSRELAQLIAEESEARAASEALTGALQGAQSRVQSARTTALAAEAALERSRGARDATRAELTSLEALQAAALIDPTASTGEWLASAGLAARPRVAATLEVETGWDRAVETALGEYLEAVCVGQLEELSASLDAFGMGRLMLIEGGDAVGEAVAATLAARVRGPAAVRRQLEGVRTAASLGEALRRRGELGAT